MKNSSFNQYSYDKSPIIYKNNTTSSAPTVKKEQKIEQISKLLPPESNEYKTLKRIEPLLKIKNSNSNEFEVVLDSDADSQSCYLNADEVLDSLERITSDLFESIDRQSDVQHIFGNAQSTNNNYSTKTSVATCINSSDHCNLKNFNTYGYLDMFYECLTTVNDMFEIIELADSLISQIEKEEDNGLIILEASNNYHISETKINETKSEIDIAQKVSLNNTEATFLEDIDEIIMENRTNKKSNNDYMQNESNYEVDYLQKLPLTKIIQDKPTATTLSANKNLAYLNNNVESEILNDIEIYLFRLLQICFENLRLNKEKYVFTELNYDLAKYLFDQLLILKKINVNMFTNRNFQQHNKQDQSLLENVKWLVLINFIFEILDSIFNCCLDFFWMIVKNYKIQFTSLIEGNKLVFLYK
jgi:hypothetical protein